MQPFMTFVKSNWVALVAVIIAIIALGVHSGVKLGGATNYDEVDVTAAKIGTSGTRFGQFIPTTCNLIGTDASQAASSTLPYDCTVTGLVSGDYVLALLSTSTARGGSSFWAITAVKASSTANTLTVLLTNNGPAAVPSATNVGSSTNVWTAHPVTSVPGL